MRNCLWGALLAFLLQMPAWAGSVAGTGGSTEITQLLNNGQLVESVAKQAEQVANQIRQITEAVDRKILMIQNLRNLPAAAAALALAPLQKDLQAYLDLYRAVNDIKTASQQAAAMIQQRGSEMAYLNLSPKDYLAQEIALANTRGGIYAREFDRDSALITTYNEKSAALAQATQNAANITGTVQGLQALATQNAIGYSVTLDMAQVLTEQKAAVAQKSQEDQLRMAANGDRALREMAAKAAQNAADNASGAQFQLQSPAWWSW